MLNQIIFIVNDLGKGGAQRNLYKFLEKYRSSEEYINYEIILIVCRYPSSFSSSFLEDYIKLGLKLHFLYDGNFVKSIHRYVKLLLTLKPRSIVSWLYFSDLISVGFKLFNPKSLLVWNIRNGTVVRKNLSSLSYFSAFFCSLLSWLPDRIISPSFVSIQNHIKFGYQESKFCYVPNFIEATKRSNYCKQKQFVIFGYISRRFDSQKGFDFFMEILSKLPPQLNIVFYVKGDGFFCNEMSNPKSVFYPYRERIKIFDHSFLMSEFYPLLDYNILTSRSEAFPNVIAESMAYGIPNISTNAGDAQLIIQDSGRIVSFGNTDDFVKEIIYFYNLYNNSFDEYLSLREKAKSSIVDRFNPQTISKEYFNLIK